MSRMIGVVVCVVGWLISSAAAQPGQAAGAYQHAAVAADHRIASEAGVEMLKLGGNAVDAAVATSFCLSVVRPYSCGIGGGGFMLIYIPGDGGNQPRAVAINYRETAPAAVGPDYYVKLDDKSASRDGVHAAGVPGTVAGLLWALEHYGTLDRRTVLAPAIRAAELGFVADADHVGLLDSLQRRLEADPKLAVSGAYIRHQLYRDGEVEVGDTISNPAQARALRLIAQHGADTFYRGEIADAIAQTMQANGGPITKQDLASYTVRVAEPLRGTFQGLDVLSMPPPSSGGVAMQQIFGLLERHFKQINAAPHNSPPYVHLLVEAMKHAFADRAEWLADAAFVHVPIERLLSAAYLNERADSISMQRTNESQFYGSRTAGVEDGGTSHLSVIDANGMAVACTETINLSYGSLVVVPGFGFALNNEMDDFTTIPGEANAFGLQQSDRNLPEPGKRPLSSMSPTILVDDGRVVLVAGASGGPRIITATTQCILNCLLFDMTPAQAVAAPRFHHQWMPNVLQFESAWPDPAVPSALQQLGHETGTTGSVGVVQLIRVTPDGIRAASDPRKGGAPAGY